MFDIEKAEREKKKFQDECEKISIENDHLIINAATGTGKTLAALKCIENFPMDRRILFLFKETNHIENTKKDIYKHGKDNLLPFMDFSCYASLKKYKGGKYHIVCDECHGISDAMVEHFKTMDIGKMVSLSATIPPKVLSRLKTIKYPLYQYSLPIKEAIRRGILPEPKVKYIYTELDDKHAIYEYKMFKKSKPKLVTAKEYYRKITARINDYQDKNDRGELAPWEHNQWMRLTNDRKKFLATYKTDLAQKVVLEMNQKNKKFICFTGSVDQAILLGGDHAISSRNTAKKNQKLIDDFNNDLINSLFTNMMLRESMNLVGIECALIVQLDSQSGSFEQMAGRGMRSVVPQILVLVVKDTQDEKYLNRVKPTVDKKHTQNYTI